MKEKCERGIFITNEISDIFCLMFADDVANCSDNVLNLQTQLNTIDKFCNDTNMQINPNETEIIVCRNGSPLRDAEKWMFRGKSIKVLSVYMGLSFTPKLSRYLAKRKLALQARKSIFRIYQFQRPFGKFPYKEYFKIFDSMVMSILTYGAKTF